MSQVVPEANSEFKAEGEVNLRGRSASFDKYRIRSPRVNLTARTDGSWAGTLNEHAFDLSVDENSIRGVDLVLSKADSTPGHIVITGQLQGKILRFEFDDKQAMIRGSVSNTYYGRAIQNSDTVYGPAGELMLKGAAGSMTPPWPQFGLALLAAFGS